MDNYIKQLIEQFHESADKVPSPTERCKDFDLSDDGEVEYFQYVEQFMYGTPHPLSEILGIEKINLPEDTRLNDKQVKILANETEALWHAYHFHPEFPEDLPARLRYSKMRECWDKEQVYVGAGYVHIEFCNFDEEDCPFQGYCKTCEE